MHVMHASITQCYHSRVCCQGLLWTACHTVWLTFQGPLALIILHHEQPGGCICVDLSAVCQQPGSQRWLTHKLNTPCGVVPAGWLKRSSNSPAVRGGSQTNCTPHAESPVGQANSTHPSGPGRNSITLQKEKTTSGLIRSICWAGQGCSSTPGSVC